MSVKYFFGNFVPYDCCMDLTLTISAVNFISDCPRSKEEWRLLLQTVTESYENIFQFEFSVLSTLLFTQMKFLII